MDTRLTAVRWRRAFEIFERVAEEPQGAREKLLNDACGDDTVLLKQVRALLESDEGDAAFITDAVAHAASVSVQTAAQSVGEWIGPYRVMREIGHGGMGSVYLAVRDDDQYRKQVAIKLVGAHMRSPLALARFRNERQILASLEHTNIARLLDGGTTPQGIPYVAMEYVDGEPITNYCFSRAISIEDRLRLFLKVCSAVHYAHQNLIVHRDIKPGNILVTADGEPKLLDFGIAKLLRPEASDFPVLQTAALSGLMTLPYASPEQIRGGPITTATDVYQLGVLLYECLTGRRPFDDAGGDLESLICHTPPERPSTSINRYAGGGHPHDVHIFRKKISGDLDNIVLMALRKEPDRRYSSVEQFAEDIRRYLDGYPVSAREDTHLYRMSRFVGRHKAGVSGAVLLITMLAAFGIGMTILARRTALERDRAEAVSSLILRMFQLADPSEVRGNSVTAREILDRGADNVDEQLRNQPELQAQLQETLGEVYEELGLLDKSILILQKALDTRLKLRGDTSAEVAGIQNLLGYSYQNRGDNATAEKLDRQALAIRQRIYGTDDLRTASSMVQLGNVLRVSGKLDEAETLHRRALDVRKRRLSPDDLAVAESEQFLAQVLQDRAKFDEVEALFRRSLDVRRRKLGPDHRGIAEVLNNLGLFLTTQARYQEAVPLYEEALSMRRRLFGNEHADVANSLNNLGALFSTLDRTEEAEPLLREALRMRMKVLGPAHPYVAWTAINLANLLHRKGDNAQAEMLYRQSADIVKAGVGEEHPYYSRALRGLGVLLLEQGRIQEASPVLEKALRLREKTYGGDHPLIAESLTDLARLRTAEGQLDEAATLLHQAAGMLSRTLKPNHPDNALPLVALGDVLMARGDFSDAQSQFRQALSIVKQVFPPGHHRISSIEAKLALCAGRLAGRSN